ncbi:MAG TPA: hypothetical protein VF204_22970 [Streptosporangiaceae bacterium]
MTVAALPGQRVAQAPLSYRKNVAMLRGPQQSADVLVIDQVDLHTYE